MGRKRKKAKRTGMWQAPTYKLLPGEPWEPETSLEVLIQQFSNQFSFVRELIANSIEAQSPRVVVSCAYRESDCEICVEDWGSGISLETIQERIAPILRGEWTCGDIEGRANGSGLGFISCFALAPQKVLVETSAHCLHISYQRQGRKSDLSYQITALEQPRQGTLVRWYKSIQPEEFPAYQNQVGNVARLWFRNPRCELLFNGQDIRREPLFDNRYTCRLERPGLTLHLWPTSEEKPYFGFFRNGMTLAEGQEIIVQPGIAVRADCVELRLTLTRDDVVKNSVYQCILADARALVARELIPKLIADLNEDALRFLAYHPKHCKLPLLCGGTVPMRQLQWTYNLWGAIFWDDQPTEQSRALQKRGIPVLRQLPDGLDSFLRNRFPEFRQASVTLPPPGQGFWEKVFSLYSRLSWNRS